MLIFQLLLFCMLYTLPVWLAVQGGAVNVLFFYPKSYQDVAFKRGISDPLSMMKKKRRFMIPYCSTVAAALVLILGLWNKVPDFPTAYLQALLFLVVVNWYDGIVIDKLWVGHSRKWIIPGMEDIPYVQTWKQVLIKRGIITAVFIPLGAVAALLALILF